MEAVGLMKAKQEPRAGLWAMLREDVASVFQRDPAARATFEVVTTYPGVHAILIHRLANRVWRRGWRYPARFLAYFRRFFYYQHRYEDALRVADRVSGGRSGHHPPGDHQVCPAPWSNQSLDRCSKRSTAVSRVTVTSDRNPCPSARRSVKTPALASSDRPSADPSAVHLASHLDAARI